MRMRLGIVEYMDAAHMLPGHSKCSVLHGHTYKIELVIEGEPEGGILLDFGEMKKILREVLIRYDHRLLNDLIDYPSVENLCLHLKKELEPKLRFRFTLRVWEGEGKWAET